VISQSHNINTLVQFAISLQLQPALEADFAISKVKHQTREVVLPTSREGWEPAFDAINLDSYLRDNLTQKLLLKPCPRSYRVHCECAVIEYLETCGQSQLDNIPGFNYIGVSKLSCRACRVWIESFNQQGEKQYYTRGSHGRWYWPWAMPEVPGFRKEGMVENLRSQFQEHGLETALTESTMADSISGSDKEEALSDSDSMSNPEKSSNSV